MKKWFLVGFFFFLSRLFFLTPQPIFFDSAEYLARFQDPSYWHAIFNGHVPLHAGYILVFWPVFHLAQWLHLPAVNTVLFGQIALAFCTALMLFDTVRLLTQRPRVAFFGTLLFSLTPLYWITNVTVMMETTYLFFFVMSWWCVTQCVRSAKKNSVWLIAGMLSFLFAYLTHPFVFLWLPALVTLSLWATHQRRRKFFFVGVGFTISFLLASLSNSALIAFGQHASLLSGFQALYFSKLGEQATFALDVHTLLVYARNFLIPLWRDMSFLVVMIGFAGMIELFRKNKKLFFLSVLFLLPAVITNQYWDSLFPGRHSLVAGMMLAITAASFLSTRKVLAAIVSVYLIFVTGYALHLLRQPAPYLVEADAVAQLPPNGLLLESHFARPQTQGKYHGEVIFVDEPSWPEQHIRQIISDAVAHHQPVFISSAALSEPYGLYMGPYLHPLSLSYLHSFQLQPVLEHFTLEQYQVVNAADNLFIYKVVSTQPHAYPGVPKLQNSVRRIDFADPFTQIWLHLK